RLATPRVGSATASLHGRRNGKICTACFVGLQRRSDVLIMGSIKKPNLDPIRIAQRILKYVLVPVAIFGGMIGLYWEVRRNPEQLDQLIRLAVAAALGGLIGVERQLSGHWAGL